VPRISVSDASANVTAITLEESVEIQVLLNNTGGSDGRFEVELLQNSTVVERRDVAVSPETTSLVTFQRTFDQTGTYSIQVNDIFVAAVEVSEGDATVLDSGVNGTRTASGGSGPLSPAVTAIAILLVALLARRRDRPR
jgi:formate-dependent phosphoribosylglycinamide formyltransferase (GAR transformylase)